MAVMDKMRPWLTDRRPSKEKSNAGYRNKNGRGGDKIGERS